MMNVKKYILAVLAIGVSCFFVWPWLESNDYNSKREQELNTPAATVWKYTNDVGNIVSRIPEIANVQLLDSTATSLKFKATTHSGQWLVLQSVLTSDTTRDLNFLNSSFGYTGTWHYTIRDMGNDQCKIFVIEKSHLKNFWLKLLLLIAGRDILVEEEIRGIQWMAKEDQ